MTYAMYLIIIIFFMQQAGATLSDYQGKALLLNQWIIYKINHAEVQYKLKKYSNKECCKQCRYAMFKGTMTKWPVQKLTQGTTQNSCI